MSVCNSEDKTKQVMDIVYGETTSLIEAVEFLNKTYENMFTRCESRHFYNKHKFDTCPYCEPPTTNTNSNKKQELIDSLNYLKKKENKTEKDKESIYIIQTVLNGMR